MRETIRGKLFEGDYERDYLCPDAVVIELQNEITYFETALKKFTDILHKYENSGDHIPSPITHVIKYTSAMCNALNYARCFSEIQQIIQRSSKPEPNMSATKKINVFISYSWDGTDHENKVAKFTEYLRKNGFHAEIDKMKSQQETAIDFIKMMHRAINENDKIIIVLSPGYKTKADAFSGGVGTEFLLILKDIEDHPKKYILVSFDGISKESIPVPFRGRQIVKLTEKFESDELFAKLMDVETLVFSEVALTLPTIQSIKVADIEINTPKAPTLVIANIICKGGNKSLFSNLLKWVEYEIIVDIENQGKTTIDQFSLQLEIPYFMLPEDTSFERDGQHGIITQDFTRKLFAGQKNKI